MLLKTFVMGSLEVNTYVLACEKEKIAAIIDFGGYYLNNILEFIDINTLSLKYIFLTHAHSDHSNGVYQIQDKFNIPVFMSELDVPLLEQMQQHSQKHNLPPTKIPANISFIKECDNIKLGQISINVIETPGHTPGSICFYLPKEKVIFTGDTIFKDYIGKTYSRAGLKQIISSIHNKILPLDDMTCIYPGHGPKTILGYERINNPYVRERKNLNKW